MLTGQTARSANDALNIAFVGVGGRGRAAVAGLAAENAVAFCDVDEVRAGETFAKHPGVARFSDYRQMFDRLGNKIDAVAVCTPDHMHFPIARAAIEMGKHVFVEKPLTHTIWESRQLARLAAGRKVATQMGNQGHAFEGPRLLKEWWQAGILGDVREIHTWTSRPSWPQGIGEPDHSKFIPVTPSTLHWDLWLGVAASRAYDPAYLPFNWRGYWDFGTGAMGDMGCHLLDGAFWALELGAPTRVQAISAKQTGVSHPTAATIVFEFPARNAAPGVTWTWYDGGLEPTLPLDFELARKLPANGTLVVGSKSTVLAGPYYESVRIVPEIKMKELAPSLPPETLRRIEGGHYAEWVRACKGGPPAGANFEYSSRLTEFCLLGTVAIRARRSIEWDSAAMEVTNFPAANHYVTKEYRSGFGI